jgi:hypothetical protein
MSEERRERIARVIPDFLAELTDEYKEISTGQRAVDCYYCGNPLLFGGRRTINPGPNSPLPARRTVAHRDDDFGGQAGIDVWIRGMEQALDDAAKDPDRAKQGLNPIVRTKLMNKSGKRAFEGYNWA